MTLQPIEHRSTQAVQSPAVQPARATKTAAPKKRATAEEVIRAAKAKICRRKLASRRNARLSELNGSWHRRLKKKEGAGVGAVT
jgi:hypothetical protein